jgi:hypothetical protein
MHILTFFHAVPAYFAFIARATIELDGMAANLFLVNSCF